MPDLNRKENYYVKATLIGKSAEICDVPCKVFLPERIYEKPCFLFKPNIRSDAQRLMSLHGGKFKALIVGSDKKVRTTIEAQEVYLSQSGTTYWGAELSESTAQAEPQHLLVIHHIDNPELQDTTQIVFWITPNELLAPPMSCTSSYTGEVNYDRHGKVEFVIKDGIKLGYERYFNTKNIDNGDLVQWSHLVACAELTTAATDLEALQSGVLPDIDDFLLIASLAVGHRTACLGWDATDKKSHATYYRGNYAFPDCNKISNIHDRMPDFQNSNEFIEVCYANFLAYENQLALRSAICAAVPLDQHDLEVAFLSRFAGLETLLLSFRRQEELEHILPQTSWGKLKMYLKKCIKESNEPKLEPEQRASIYRKLDELNRVSISEAFDIFCQKYGIYLSDLWPVFGEKNAIGLVEIRNRLIHGDPFPSELLHALAIANMHLQFTLERSIVRVLGWDIAKTRVNPTYLGQYFTDAMKNYSLERKRITDYIHS